VGRVEQGEGGLQIFVGQVGQGQGVCPLETFHLSQMGLQGREHFPTTITRVTPGEFEFGTKIVRVCINICRDIDVESNVQISNIFTLKRWYLQVTTWYIVPYEIYGPCMSRRGQGRCSNLVKNMLTPTYFAPFEKFWYAGKEEAKAAGGYYETCKGSRKVCRKPCSLDQCSFE